MPMVTAVVEQVSSKPRTTRFGVKDTYSFKAGGEWFSTGFKKHNLNVGDSATFSYTDGSYGKDVDPASITKGTPTTSPSGAKTAAAVVPSYGGKGVFPIPPLDGQRAIVRQNALTNARELVCTHIPSTLYDASTETCKYEEVADLIVKVARKFEAYSCGDLDMEEVENELTEADRKAA
jgi:hypothetical protein